ncbi:MAG: hypothetical protein KBF88_16815 [Polyangiaceae bacterium]|nr:hypothetical protein [Polyangiaceae bacterium]
MAGRLLSHEERVSLWLEPKGTGVADPSRVAEIADFEDVRDWWKAPSYVFSVRARRKEIQEEIVKVSREADLAEVRLRAGIAEAALGEGVAGTMGGNQKQRLDFETERQNLNQQESKLLAELDTLTDAQAKLALRVKRLEIELRNRKSLGGG